jgi:hypothetical protein
MGAGSETSTDWVQYQVHRLAGHHLQSGAHCPVESGL